MDWGYVTICEIILGIVSLLFFLVIDSLILKGMSQYVLNHWTLTILQIYQVLVFSKGTYPIGHTSLTKTFCMLAIFCSFGPANRIALVKWVSVKFCRMSKWSRFLWTMFWWRVREFSFDNTINKHFCLIHVSTTWYSFLIVLNFVLEYSWLTMLWQFPGDRKGTQPYSYMYPFSPKFSSHPGYDTPFWLT